MGAMGAMVRWSRRTWCSGSVAPCQSSWMGCRAEGARWGLGRSRRTEAVPTSLQKWVESGLRLKSSKVESVFFGVTGSRSSFCDHGLVSWTLTWLVKTFSYSFDKVDPSPFVCSLCHFVMIKRLDFKDLWGWSWFLATLRQLCLDWKDWMQASCEFGWWCWGKFLSLHSEHSPFASIVLKQFSTFKRWRSTTSFHNYQMSILTSPWFIRLSLTFHGNADAQGHWSPGVRTFFAPAALGSGCKRRRLTERPKKGWKNRFHWFSVVVMAMYDPYDSDIIFRY